MTTREMSATIVPSNSSKKTIEAFIKLRAKSTSCLGLCSYEFQKDGYLVFLLERAFNGDLANGIKFAKLCAHSGVPYHKVRAKLVRDLKKSLRDDGYIVDLDRFRKRFITGSHGCLCE